MQRVRFAQAAPFVIVAAGFVFSVAINWPGHLSYDSAIQVLEGRTARYSFWHPAVMSWLLGAFDRVLTGTGLFVLFDALLLFRALGLAFYLPKRSSWTGVLLALLCVLTPQFLLYAGIVWKDVLFAGASALGFLLIALAADRWSSPRVRVTVIPAALLFLVLGALARQNGAVVIPIGALVLGWIAFRLEARAPVLNAVLYCVGSLSLMLVVFGCVWFALETRHVGQSGPAGQFRLLQTYDIAGALHANPALELDPLDNDEPLLAGLMRGTAARLYTPERNDTLASSRPLQQALLNAGEGEIAAQWQAIVVRHPLLYLGVRWDAFRWVLFTPNTLACRPVFAGVTGAQPVLGELGLSVRFDTRDRVLTSYALAFVGTPVLSHATFLLISLVCLFVLLWRRNVIDLAIAGLIVSALVFVLSFFVISLACDYRYLYFLDVTALVAAAYLSSDAEELAARSLLLVKAGRQSPVNEPSA